jgi:hypothetical protein
MAAREAKSRRRPVLVLKTTDASYEALFASSLQKSDRPTPAIATAAISDTLQELGPDGCSGRMAQEFGDHPDEARSRMRWARELVSAMVPGQ